jgi:hypothetical protein
MLQQQIQPKNDEAPLWWGFIFGRLVALQQK